MASSVFDAATKALAALGSDSWADPIGPATRLAVQVREPTITHSVTVQQLARWANGAAKSPEERLQKERLMALLAPQKAETK